MSAPIRIAACLSVLFCAQSALAAESATQELPPWKPLVIPRALVVVGPWGDEFRWREALHEQGILYEDGYRVQNGYQRPNVYLINVPTTDAEMRSYSVIVLANVDAPALGPERLAAVQRFVNQGGGLVVLGGYWAYSRGGYAGTPLDPLLPVSFPPENRIPALSPGVALAPLDAPWLKANFADRPRVYFLQQLVPRLDAEVVLRAGDAPALVTGKFGRGRVAACALTVNGKAEQGELPFWEWDAWPSVLGQTIEWAAQNRPLRDPGAAMTEARPLTADEIEQVRLKFQPVDETFVTRFVAAPTAQAAGEVFEHWFGEEPANGAISAAAIDALARFARPEWNARLLQAADGLNANRSRRRAALELLGASQSADAAKVLLAAISDDDVAPGAVDGLRRLSGTAHIPTLLKQYERVLPLTDFRNPVADATNDAAATRQGMLAMHIAAALYHLGEPKGAERLMKHYAEIRLLRRIFANAAKRRVVETDPTGVAIRNAIAGKQNDFAALEAYLLAAAGPVPNAAVHALALEATDESEVRWLAAAMIASPRQEWSLKGAKDGTIRRLSEALRPK